ncbi:MAG TPA: hypothetical protein DCM87_21535 [Planctomycetes bacterium]|nr:hypothetical protein [Planctomycetota bacterium]
MRGMRALIGLALRQALRGRGLAAACAAVYACILGLAFAVAAEGPKEANLKFYVTAAWLLLAGFSVCVVAYLPLRFFGAERAGRQVHLLGTRPVTRAAFIGARFCAGVLIAGAVLAAGCAVIGAGASVCARRLGIEREALAGCAVRPAPPKPVSAGQVRELAAVLGRDAAFLERHGERGVAAVARESLAVWRLTEGESARIVWPDVGPREGGLRVRVNARVFPPWEIVEVEFRAGAEVMRREIQSGVACELRLPGDAIGPDGALAVTVALPAERKALVYFPPGDGLALYLPEIGFGENLARAGLLFFAFTAAIGGFTVLSSAALSRAVSALAAAVIVFAALSANTLSEAAAQFTGTLGHSHGEAAPEPLPRGVREVWQKAVTGMLAVVPTMRGIDPGAELVEGRTIGFGAVAAVAVHGTLLRGGGALLLAWLVFRRRELGKRV